GAARDGARAATPVRATRPPPASALRARRPREFAPSEGRRGARGAPPAWLAPSPAWPPVRRAAPRARRGGRAPRPGRGACPRARGRAPGGALPASRFPRPTELLLPPVPD